MAGNLYDQALEDLDGPGTPSNPYDETLALQDSSRETRLRSSVIQAQATTPDRAAKVQTLSQRTGLPPDVIERNFDAIVKRAQVADTPYTQMQRETPALATWAEQPQNMAVAHDDMEQLGAIEWMLTAPQRAVRQGIAQVEYGQLRSESIRRTLTAEEHVRLDTLKAQMEEGGALGAEGHWFRGAITGTAQQIPLWVGALMQGVKYAGPAAATAGVAGAAVGGPLTAIPLFGLGWSAGMIAGGVSFTADIEAGLALDEMDSFRDELGQPLDPAVANVAAAATGLINGLIEQSQIETLTKHVPGLEKLTSGGVRAAVKTALRVPTVRAALAQAAKTYVGTLVSETGQEVAQRGVAILSGELAKVVSGQSIPLRSGPDIATDLAQEAAGAVQTFALMLAPGPLLETRVNLQRARQASQNVNFFTALGEGVANSKTVQRSPEAAQAFLAEATKDGPISHVYAPVETWTSYWQSKGVDPAAMAARVTGEPEAYQRAVDSGQDLAIPTASYAVTLAGTEHNAYFANELRLAPDQMNARESAAFAQQQLAEQPAAAATTESTAPVAAIREPFVASLVAAGVPKATAESYATVFEHALPTIAERTGVDLAALVQQWLPEVQSASIAPTPPLDTATVDQAAAPEKAKKGRQGTTFLQSAAPVPISVYQRAGDLVDGRRVRSGAIPNTSSIDASITDAEVLPGIREVPFSAFTLDAPGPPQFANAAEEKRTRALAAEMEASGEVTPLIVAIDEQGPYILEGGHRFDALKLLGARSFPALVVIDREAVPDEFTQGERGKITFRGRRQPPVITLFAHRDLSTTLHEAGHLFLELQGDMIAQMGRLDQATLTDQQRRFQNDYVATLAFLGVESRTQIGTEQHEQYARGFEAYLMEGKAPSLEMRTAFARFRSWLLGLYRSVRGLNVELSDEMRAVFDRLLASDQAIAEAEQLGHLAPMFTTAESAGMTPERFDLYRATVEDASRQAREQVDQRLLADVQREQQAEWQAQRAAQQTTVSAEVQQRPVYRALAAIRKGTHADGTPLVEGQETPPLKLSKAILMDRYGAERLKALPRPYIYSVEGGLDPDVVAEMFGFSSGDALLTAITEAPPMRDVIEAETDRRMLAEHGSILLDGTLHETAQAATANESREEVVRAEMRALGALKRTAAPFEAAGRDAVKEAQREQAYERRWLEAEARLRIAIAEGRKQVDLDALRDDVRRLEQQARGGARTIAAGIPPAAVLREVARSRIAGTRIRELNPMLFWSASRRAAQQAIDHATRQDFDAAITAKQQELVNLALYREAERVKTDIAARVAFAQGLGKGAARERLGLAGESYLDQVDGILDRYSFARVSQKALDRRASLRKWMAAMEGEGRQVDLPEELLEETRRVPYQELTVEELVGVTDGLRHIVHLARTKNRLLKAKGERDLERKATRLAQSIRDNFRGTRRAAARDRRPSEERRRTVDDWFAGHRKLASLLREMDGFADGGPATEAIMFALNEAGSAEAEMHATATEKLSALVETAYPGAEKRGLYTKVEVPAIGTSLSKMERLSIALNWGNEGNRQRIRAGEQWNDQQVQAILDTLDLRDMTFVQGVLDFVDSYWTAIEAKQRRVFGVAPEKVVAVPIRTVVGEFRGGYYSLKYDDRLSASAIANLDLEAANLARQAAYVQATTRRGHTKERAQKVKLPVRRDFGVIFEHVGQVIHDLSHHEALIDVGRILGHAAVQQAILETHGDLVYKQIRGTIRDVAFGDVPATNGFERAINHVRMGATIAGLGWNLTTALLQPMGLFNSAVRIGPVWVGKGVMRWLRHPTTMVETVEWITDKSAFMRSRGRTQQREINEIRNAVGVNTGRLSGWIDEAISTVTFDKVTRQGIADSYFWLIQQMQRVADIPTWLGAYEKAMANSANDEARAIALADQAVLDSQGGGQTKDLAQVQRGGPMMRLWTNFYSFFNVLYNQAAESTKRTRFTSPGAIGRLAVDYLMLFVAPATLGYAIRQAIKPGDDNDKDSLAWRLVMENLSYLSGLMLGVRETSAALQGYYGYEGPAGARAFAALSRLGQQVQQGEADAAFWRALNDTGGILFHYPSGQAQRTLSGIAALAEGKTENPGAVLTGAPRKKQ